MKLLVHSFWKGVADLEFCSIGLFSDLFIGLPSFFDEQGDRERGECEPFEISLLLDLARKFAW